MKLSITRDQDKGLMGGISFVLQVQVQLAGDEQEIIQKYKAHKEVLLTKTISIMGRSVDLAITIGGLMEGQKFKCKDIAEILTYEENVKDACSNFKNYIEIMSHFGGEEIIEYN